MNVTRRDLLTVAGGGAVGILLTPAPWKLVDDLAIWTQNWKWIPRPPRGTETTRATACALCPRGCAVDARCIGGLPVAMRAAAGGTLCPLGLTAHHLPYHPARLATPVRIVHGDASRAVSPVTLDAIVAATARAIGDAAAQERDVAVLDMRPGRSISWAWQALLGAMPHAAVAAAPGRQGASFDALARIAGAGGAIGADLSIPRTILSFGAPLAEGWGPPAAFERILSNDLRLIQVEPLRTQTAAGAARWIPCRPGSEALVALAIAKALLVNGLVDPEPLRAAGGFEGLHARLAGMTSGTLLAATSVTEATVVAVARDLASNRPALALAGEQPGGGRHAAEAESAILALNILLGAFESGALVRRAELPPPVADAQLAPVDELERLEDGSLALLLIDASAGDAAFPWPLAQRKLAPGAPVVALSPFLAGTAAHADFVVPTLPFLEAPFELPSSPDAPAATLALSAPVLLAREGATDPAAFIRALAQAAGIALPGEWSSSEELGKLRVAAIHAAARGSIVDRSATVTPIASFGSADDVWTALTDGSRWIDVRAEAFSVLRSPFSVPPPAPGPAPGFSTHLALLPIAASDVTQSAAVSPVLTKLYRESSLRRSSRTVILNPATARELSVRDGREAILVTEEGKARVRVATDESVMPGVAALVIGPEPEALGDPPGHARIVDICPADANGVWRRGTARLVEG